jgi:streptogrisin B
MGNFIYPEYYGGVYLDSDGNLVFLVVASMSEMVMGRSSSFSSMSDEVSFREVEFSFADLNRTDEALGYIVDERIGSCPFVDNITSFGVSHSSNRLIVRLEVYNEYMVQGFRENVLDSEMIILEQGERFVIWEPSYSTFRTTDDATATADHLRHSADNYFDAGAYFEEQGPEGRSGITLNPGDRLRYSSPPFFFDAGSMGYRVIRNSDGRSGFVTTAHTLVGSNPNVFIRHGVIHQQVGRIEHRLNNATMDAVFVYNNTPVLITNTLPGGRPLSTNVFDHSRMVEAQLVTLFGATSGRSQGQIINTSYSSTFSGIRRNNMVQTDIRSQHGDSGGVIATAEFGTAGILLGGVPGGDNSTFVPASRINSTLGLRRY